MAKFAGMMKRDRSYKKGKRGRAEEWTGKVLRARKRLGLLARTTKVKDRRSVCTVRAPFDKEVLAILPAKFLPGDGFWLAQNGLDTLAGKVTPLGQSLGCTAGQIGP
jgi:hypothetical protein